MLPADQLDWVRGTELAYQRCADAGCARAIATKAEAIVRASQMGVAEGADEGTIMAKLCPAPQADEAHAHMPNDALAALAAKSPCKWRPVAREDLAPIPGVGQRTLVQIGDDGVRAAPGTMGDPAGPALNRRRSDGGMTGREAKLTEV